MPNWCNNSLTIVGPTDVIKEIFATKLSLQQIFPVPQELIDTSSPCDPKIAKINIEKYGYSDWYEFSKHNWGTKWDIGPIEDNFIYLEVSDKNGKAQLSATFESAWSPPIEAMQKLENKYPNIDLRLEYVETGCAFVGVYQNGIDDCRDYSSADDLEAIIKELKCSIAEPELDSIREYESEES